MVAEVAYLIGQRLGARAEVRFVASLRDYDVRCPEPEDWNRISGLVEKYADLPLGAADASVIVLADRFRTRLILTTDRRHFRVTRSMVGQPFELLPEL